MRVHTAADFLLNRFGFLLRRLIFPFCEDIYLYSKRQVRDPLHILDYLHNSKCGSIRNYIQMGPPRQLTLTPRTDSLTQRDTVK